MAHNFDVNRFIQLIPNLVFALFFMLLGASLLISQKVEEWKERRDWKAKIKKAEEEALAERQYRKDKLFNDVKASFRLGYRGLHYREWREAKTEDERDNMMRKYSDEMFDKYFK